MFSYVRISSLNALKPTKSIFNYNTKEVKHIKQFS